MVKKIQGNQKGKMPDINLIVHKSSYTKEPTFQSRNLTQTFNQTARKPQNCGHKRKTRK